MQKALAVIIYVDRYLSAEATQQFLPENQFFQLLSEELFDVETSGLWSKKYGDEINWFNPSNNWDENGYEMIGVLFGLAVYNSVLLDVRFPLGETKNSSLTLFLHVLC